MKLPNILNKDREQFEKALPTVIKSAGPLGQFPKINATLRKSMFNALSERDETAEICRDKDGHPEADSELHDYEKVPLAQDIWVYFESEVKPHVPDAWVNDCVRDHKDSEIGKIGYEINFNHYFYQHEQPRQLEEIEKDNKKLEDEIINMPRSCPLCLGARHFPGTSYRTGSLSLLDHSKDQDQSTCRASSVDQMI